jgi:uncharacterized protein YgiM (DUF1202 family)
MKTFRPFSVLAIALIVAVSTVLVGLVGYTPAQAQGATAIVTSSGAYVRGGPGAGFWIIATLRRNQIVPVIGVSTDRAFWLVKTEFGDGFVSGKVVSAKDAEGVPVVPTDPIGMIKAGNAAVRGGPGVEAAHIGTLGRGAQFYVVGRSPDGRWIQMRYNQLVGWVATSVTNLTVEAASGATGATVGTPKVIINVSFLNLRSGPGDQYSILAKLRGGRSYALLGKNGNAAWFYIDTQYGRGWVNAHNVLTQDYFGDVPVVDIASNEYAATVITGAAAIRQGPGTTFTRIGVAPARAEVTIVGKSPDNEWWLVRYNKIQGWMSKAVLRAPAEADAVPVVHP